MTPLTNQMSLESSKKQALQIRWGLVSVLKQTYMIVFWMCIHAERLNSRLAGQVELRYFHGVRFPLLLYETVVVVLFTAWKLHQHNLQVVFEVFTLVWEYNGQPAIQDSSKQVIIRLLQCVTLGIWNHKMVAMQSPHSHWRIWTTCRVFPTPCDSKDLLEALDIEGFQSVLQGSSGAYKLHSILFCGVDMQTALKMVTIVCNLRFQLRRLQVRPISQR